VSIGVGHEAEAQRALDQTEHNRLMRFLLEVVGWPVAGRDRFYRRRTNPSHEHSVPRDE
jgi:hypothetical protein